MIYLPGIKRGMHTKLSERTRWMYSFQCAVGEYSIIDDFCYISCALEMGAFSHIGANCTLLGGGMVVRIGDFVDIGPGCRIVSASHDYGKTFFASPAIPIQFREEAIRAPVYIHDHCLLGAGTVVLPGVELPEGVSSGAMTLFTDRVKYEPWTVYAGIPARPLHSRCGKKNAHDMAERIKAECLS